MKRFGIIRWHGFENNSSAKDHRWEGEARNRG
jgi:hypothetical protein